MQGFQGSAREKWPVKQQLLCRVKLLCGVSLQREMEDRAGEVGRGGLMRPGVRRGNPVFLRAGTISLALCCSWDGELRGARCPFRLFGGVGLWAAERQRWH